MLRAYCVILVLVLLSACATRPRPAPLLLGQAPVADLLGLSQDEFLTRLGGRARGAFYVTHVRMEDDVRVAEMNLALVIRGACPEDLNWPNAPIASVHQVRGEREYGNASVITATFHNERLVVLRNTSQLGDGGDIQPDTQIVLSCFARGHALTSAELAFLPVLPIGLALAAIDEAHEFADAPAVLASLRLDEGPPGGLDAFVAAHERVVSVTRRAGEDADVLIAFKAGDDARTARVSIRAGRVQAIDAPHRLACRLTAEGSVRCGGSES